MQYVNVFKIRCVRHVSHLSDAALEPLICTNWALQSARSHANRARTNASPHEPIGATGSLPSLVHSFVRRRCSALCRHGRSRAMESNWRRCARRFAWQVLASNSLGSSRALRQRCIRRTSNCMDQARCFRARSSKRPSMPWVSQTGDSKWRGRNRSSVARKFAVSNRGSQLAAVQCSPALLP